MTAQLHLTRPENVARFASLLPPSIDAARFARLCALAVHQSPGLVKCSPSSLLQAFLACATLGLEPNTLSGHAYVLPFADKASLIVGYKGFVALIHRSDPDAVVHAGVVYEGDDFDFAYGTDAFLRHRPLLTSGRAQIAAYAYIRRRNSFDFTMLPWADVVRIRDGSQGYKLAQRKAQPSPWIDYLDAMAAKTALRHLVKTANVSSIVQVAAAIDARQEAEPGDFGGLVVNDAPGEAEPKEATP